MQGRIRELGGLAAVIGEGVASVQVSFSTVRLIGEGQTCGWLACSVVSMEKRSVVRVGLVGGEAGGVQG